MATKRKKIKSQVKLSEGVAYRLSIFFINCPYPLKMDFDGSGDSGSIDSLYIDGPEAVSTDAKNKEMAETFDNELREYASEFLEMHHGGWEINEGSYGYCAFHPNGAIELSVDERITETRNTSHTDTWNGLTDDPHEEITPTTT